MRITIEIAYLIKLNRICPKLDLEKIDQVTEWKSHQHITNANPKRAFIAFSFILTQEEDFHNSFY